MKTKIFICLVAAVLTVSCEKTPEVTPPRLNWTSLS